MGVQAQCSGRSAQCAFQPSRAVHIRRGANLKIEICGLWRRHGANGWRALESALSAFACFRLLASGKKALHRKPTGRRPCDGPPASTRPSPPVPPNPSLPCTNRFPTFAWHSSARQGTRHCCCCACVKGRGQAPFHQCRPISTAASRQTFHLQRCRRRACWPLGGERRGCFLDRRRPDIHHIPYDRDLQPYRTPRPTHP